MLRGSQVEPLSGNEPGGPAALEPAVPDFVRDLSSAYSTLRNYDDGRNFPIQPFWLEELNRLGEPVGQAQAQAQQDSARRVLFRGVATIAEKSFERLQRYFSRRIHSEARDQLIARAQVMAGLHRPGLPRNTARFLPVTEEPAGRAFFRLAQLQGPLAGAFLKELPAPHRSFYDDHWTLLSCFRFGIPIPSLPGDKWGDQAVKLTYGARLGRHDQVRDELARALKGIRGLRAHTECRVGTTNLFTDITVFGGLGDACRANPLDFDIHVHHFDGACDARTPAAAMAYREVDKERKYGPTCRRLGRDFHPLGFSAWGAASLGTEELLAMVACAADRQGYVGEVWGTLKGDKIRAMHGLCRGLSYALNKGVAMQLVQAQETALRHYVSQPRHVHNILRYTTSN